MKINKNYNYILSFFLIFSSIIDVLTFYTKSWSLSVGMILRGILLLITLINLVINYRKKENYIILVLLVIFSSIFLIIHRDMESITYLFKYLFLIIIIINLYNYYKSDGIKISDLTLNITLLLYNLIIFIAPLTNTASESYGAAKVGNIGWFNSPNEIGAIITAISVYLYINLLKKFNLFSLINLILSFVSIFIIGTKLPILIFLILIFHFLYTRVYKEIKNKKVKLIIIISIILLIGLSIIIVPKLPIYKNEIVHLKYLKIKKHPLKIFTSFKLFDHFIFNRRLTFLKNINKLFVAAPINYKLFGLNNIVKTVEMDFFDIFYRYGIMGFILFMGIFIYLINKLKNKYHNKLINIILLLPIMLSGHVLLNPNAALVVVVIFINNMYFNKEKSSHTYLFKLNKKYDILNKVQK